MLGWGEEDTDFGLGSASGLSHTAVGTIRASLDIRRDRADSTHYTPPGGVELGLGEQHPEQQRGVGASLAVRPQNHVGGRGSTELDQGPVESAGAGRSPT
ncbi:hypothetical protein [Streptomyces anulatus]|uniref:hypothetical protein n=1 Tax=Streptomyces anulatus TaxID=1892 RepID=UPI002F918B88